MIRNGLFFIGLALMVSAVVKAQTLRSVPVSPKEILDLKTPKFKNSQSSLRQGEWEVVMGSDPDLLDNNVFRYYDVIPVNTNFSCQSFNNYDEGNFSNTPDVIDNTAAWAEWAITALVNVDSQIVYPFDLTSACIAYHIDSILFAYTYHNPTNIPDTLVVELLVGNNLLWSDTIYNLFTITRPETDDLFDTASFMLLYVNVSLDTPPGIARFRFKYFAQKDSAAFGFYGLFRSDNSCGYSNCPGVNFDTDIPVKGSLRYLSRYPNSFVCNKVFSTDSRASLPPFCFDCDGSGSCDAGPGYCEDYVLIPYIFAFGKIRTTNYPATLDADIQTDDNKRLVCAGEAINVEATAGFDSYTWSGSGASGTTNIGTINISPSSVITNPDTFVITVTGQGTAIGCSASDKLTVVAFNAPPIANFVLNTTPGDPTVTVDNTSLYAVNCIWDWGDGNLSTNCEPFAYTYASTGEYTITLIVSNPCGSDTIQRTAVLTSNPIAASASLTYFHRNNAVVIEGLPAEATHILFTDAMGRTIKTVPVYGKKEVEIEINSLPSQLYNVIIMGKEGRLGMFRFTK